MEKLALKMIERLLEINLNLLKWIDDVMRERDKFREALDREKMLSKLLELQTKKKITSLKREMGKLRRGEGGK